MNEHATASGLLLRTDDPSAEHTLVPLTGVRIHAAVTGPASRVTVVQSYENREKQPIEAVYVFPAPDGAAVCGFAATIDGRRIEGRVEGREEAFDRYDDAMAAGDGTFLLDQERPNVFTASVGNLMPGQKADVEIAYLCELDRTAESIRLMIPTNVSPRYIPQHRQDFRGLTDGERVNPPVTTGPLPYALELVVEADLLSPIRSVESPSHKIRSEIDGNRVRVSLAGDEGRLDRDFVLELTPQEPAEALSCVVCADAERYAMISFRPELPESRTPIEAFFVVDCSGSMGGSSMEEARRTLQLCLHSLRPGDRFNIVRFGSSYEQLSGASLVYDDDTLARAKDYVAGMDADLGGTEILKPLTAILESPHTAEYGRRIVLLTDGQVSNENDVIDLAGRHAGTSRIFAFGIGAGASEFLVRGLARASGGAAEFVHPGEQIDDKVLRHFKRLTLPAIDFSVEWDGLEATDVCPAKIGSLCSGDSVTVLARVTSGATGRATLQGELAGRTLRFETQLVEADPRQAGDVVPVLWARQRIRALEESPPLTGTFGSNQRRRAIDRQERAKQKAEEEIVALGTRYGLASAMTSFVLVDERAEGEKAQTRAVLREVTTALTEGWGESQCIAQAGSSMFRRSLSGDMLEKQIRDHVLDTFETHSVLDKPPLPPRLHALLMQQRADGSWLLTEELAQLCNESLRTLRRAAKKSGHPMGEAILASLCMLLLFEQEDDTPEAWDEAIQKGRDWLDGATKDSAPPAGFDSWQAWAESVIAI